MQHAVNRALLEHFNADASLLEGLELNRFPYPEWTDQSFTLLVRTMLPLALMLTLLYVTSRQVTSHPSAAQLPGHATGMLRAP
jgi:hypothetical protein